MLDKSADPTACDRHDVCIRAVRKACEGVPTKWLVHTKFNEVEERTKQLLPMLEHIFKLEGEGVVRGSAKWIAYMLKHNAEAEFRDLVEFKALFDRFLELQIHSDKTDKFGFPFKAGNTVVPDAAYKMLHSTSRLPHHLKSTYVLHLLLKQVLHLFPNVCNTCFHTCVTHVSTRV